MRLSCAMRRCAMNRPVKLNAPVTTSNERSSISGLERKSREVVGGRPRTYVAADDDSRTMPDRLGRVHLRPQAVEDRKAQRAVRRPLRIPDADHDLRSDPADR